MKLDSQRAPLSQLLPTGALSAAAATGRGAAAHLSLPLRRAQWRGPSGAWSGVGSGGSVDFQDHRAYTTGDDLRRVNWSAFARSDALMVKQHRRETAPLVDVVVDLSASMTAFPAKAVRALELAAFAAACARAGGNDARLWAVTSAAPAKALDAGQLLGGGLPADIVPGHASAARYAELPWRSSALRVLVSDLLFPGDPLGVLRHLGAPGGVGLILAPFAEEEATPAWGGALQLVDAEDGSVAEPQVDARLSEEHAAAYQRHFDLWRVRSRERRTCFARVPAAGPLLEALRGEAFREGAVEPR